MFIGVGVGAYWAGIFHLMTHAFFKACLFLGSGSVILACHHEQDMRKMGGLREYTPITRWTYLAACMTIAGFPVASAFYSKDEILWKAFTARGLSAPWIGPAIYLVGTIAALGTSFYMFRSYYMTFTGKYRGGEGHAPKETKEDPHAAEAHRHAAIADRTFDVAKAATEAALASVPHEHGRLHDVAPVTHDESHGGVPHESPKSMTYVLIALAAASVLAGFIFGWPAAWGGHGPLLEHWLLPSLPAQESVPFTNPGRSTELLFQFIGGVVVAGGGWFFAWLLYAENRSTIPARLKSAFPRAWALVFNRYYVDQLYDATVVRFTRFASRVLYWFDQNVIDGLVNLVATIGRTIAYVDAAFDQKVVDGAVNLLGDAFLHGGAKLRRLQTGHIQAYLFGALAGAIAFIIIQYVIR
jgi:NADH-quinone oxidoreductase subunit L